MKIAIPVEDKSLSSKVSISFGRTPYFLIYDTETDASAFLDNSAAASQGGAGIRAAQTIVDAKVYALVTPRCGKNAAEVLKAANIKLFKTLNNVVADNITAFKDSTLPSLTEIHAGFHNHGGVDK